MQRESYQPHWLQQDQQALEQPQSRSSTKSRYYSQLKNLRSSTGTWDRDFTSNHTSYQVRVALGCEVLQDSQCEIWAFGYEV